jgi:hypothetical protein
MFKKMALFCALAGLWIQTAAAAPIGWYQLDLTWRDGRFAGQIYYDSSSPYRVTQIQGSLTDIAQTTPITHVWNLSHGQLPDPWLSFTNAQGSDIDDYNAAFYLHLLDLGTVLAVDASQDNSLYDWSQDAYYFPELLDQSPLISWAIRPAASEVPEPAGIGLLTAGLAAAVAARRRNRAAA